MGREGILSPINGRGQISGIERRGHGQLMKESEGSKLKMILCWAGKGRPYLRSANKDIHGVKSLPRSWKKGTCLHRAVSPLGVREIFYPRRLAGGETLTKVKGYVA